MQVPKPVLSETANSQRLSAGIAVPLGLVEASVQRRARAGLRRWALVAFLFLMPVVTYWPATFHDYGLRDDYSNLREAHEEPGKVVNFCASHARPIYGWLLQSTYGETTSVENLKWMRLIAAIMLGAISLVMFRGLRSLGWSFNSSLCVAMLVSLIPSAQVIAGWAVGWPYAAAALLAIGAFFIVEGAIGASDRELNGRTLCQCFVAFLLMVVCALIYQSSAMFYVVPLTAALIAQRHRSPRHTARWVGIHLGLVAAALGLAYGTMTLLYSMGEFVKSGRIAFEHHWGDKAAWFLQEPLPNALSLLVLNDNNRRDHWLYLGCAALVGSILIAGAILEWRRHGRSRGLIWLAALLGMPIFAFSISLVASERYATYRTVFAMTAVLLLFLVASVRALIQRVTPLKQQLFALLVVLAAFLSARHHVYALIAVPQGNEWQLIVAGAERVHLNNASHPRVFAIASSPADISTDTIYHDEFGSLSSNSEWVPKEMFKRAMHDLHPEIANIDARYDFATGPKLPMGQHYDVIIDMHQLRRFHTDN